MREALEMLKQGRPADAQETLAAALEAPTEHLASSDGERRLRHFLDAQPASRRARLLLELDGVKEAAHDAALEEANAAVSAAFRECERGTTTGTDFRNDVLYMVRESHQRIDALKSAPARRMLDAEEARQALFEMLDGCKSAVAECKGHPLSRASWDGSAKALRDLASRLGMDLDAAPAKDERPLYRWSRQTAQRAHLGDEDRRPDDEEDSR